ncbi:MAG: polyribonucleotide nucleotidyltransferase [Candidatus Improbicoccus devescovinae]|nr:MAG: polyribonucleotide nucleotidyltransferase [Candidatus Improbicoccus devescovinae]
MFENFRIFETKISEKKLIVETGKMAMLANGSCLVRYGETCVLATATMSDRVRDGIDFLPLSVDFEEKLYSVGKIPGSFLKREGKPSEAAVLSARLIDRALRPLFPEGFRYDVTVVCTVLAVDENCSPEITALLAASIALTISDIPWNGPIAGVMLGYVNGKVVANSGVQKKNTNKLSLILASTKEKIIMLEACADRVSEEIILDAMMLGQKVNAEVVEFIEKIQTRIGKPKIVFHVDKSDLIEINAALSEFRGDMERVLFEKNKEVRDSNVNSLCASIRASLEEKFPDKISEILKCLYNMQKNIVRNWLISQNKRVDGRDINEIREMRAEVGLLARVHGSGLFTRGYTQVLTNVTLGPLSAQQIIDGLSTDESKRYIHHYNFPAFSVGETRSSRAPGRRELGHGALAEKALLCVIPNVQDFPYTIRLVSEVLSSNGSTSQAAVCGSTLALMDAGVPISEPVAGISCGLVTDGDSWITFTDLQGIEDFFGDMDFKVAGTKTGITAMQMDLKVAGINFDILQDALHKNKVARIKILDEIILQTLPKYRSTISKYAPKIMITSVPIEKIREVIGIGGRVVQFISTTYRVKIDIEPDGRIFVMSPIAEDCQNAIDVIQNIVREVEPGDVFRAKVIKLMDFGVFVEFAPGREGLCHVSKLTNRKVERISDLLKVGDIITVRVTDVDGRGRINFRCLSVL